jgi:hypothetical protein
MESLTTGPELENSQGHYPTRELLLRAAIEEVLIPYQ